MFSKTDFNPSKALLTQLPKELTSLQKKKKYSSIGIKLTHSNSNSKRPRTYQHIPSMMDLPSLPELLIMDISQQEPSRMWSADMLVRQVTLCPEDSDGIVTVCQLSTRSTRNLESNQRSKSMIWVSINTMPTVEESS